MTILNNRLLVLILLLTLMSAKVVKSQEKNLFYQILETKKDTTLSANQSKIEFIFTNIYNEPVNIPVKILSNNELTPSTKDSNGNIHVKIESGKYVFRFQFKQRQGKKYADQPDKILTTDSIDIAGSNQYIIEVNLGNIYERSDGMIVKKPQIYFYPEKITEVKVDLNFKGKLSFTYPNYQDGWKFKAYPTGLLEIGNKEYNYIFWDGNIEQLPYKINQNEGFVVTNTELTSFLEKRLTEMGLNSKEQQDFITFWVPQMILNEKIYIHFLFNEECDSYAEMNISPKPENLFRVYMLWSNYDSEENSTIEKQTIPTLNRNGFTVIEWGGIEITDYKSLVNE